LVLSRTENSEESIKAAPVAAYTGPLALLLQTALSHNDLRRKVTGPKLGHVTPSKQNDTGSVGEPRLF